MINKKNGGEVGNYITIDSCRMNPMVGLPTINKALSGDSPDNLKKIFLLNNKSKDMFLSIVCTFGYSWF